MPPASLPPGLQPFNPRLFGAARVQNRSSLTLQAETLEPRQVAEVGSDIRLRGSGSGNCNPQAHTDYCDLALAGR